MTLESVPDERNAALKERLIATPPRIFFSYLGFRLLIAFAIFGAALWRYREPYQPHEVCGTGYESLQLACSLSGTGKFSDPFEVLATGPTAQLGYLLFYENQPVGNGGTEDVGIQQHDDSNNRT